MRSRVTKKAIVARGFSPCPTRQIPPTQKDEAGFFVKYFEFVLMLKTCMNLDYS